MLDQYVVPVVNVNMKATHTGALKANGASSLAVLGKCSGADFGSLVRIQERAAARARVRVMEGCGCHDQPVGPKIAPKVT